MRHFKNINEITKTEGEIKEIKKFLSQNEVNKILKYKNNNANYFVKRNILISVINFTASCFNFPIMLVNMPFRSI